MDAFSGSTAFLFDPDGKVCHITVVRRRLLTPLSETLLEPESEGA